MNNNILDLLLFHWWKKNRIVLVFSFFLLMAAFLRFAFNLGIIFPPQFTGEKIIKIEAGDSAKKVADIFYQSGIIRQSSDFLFFLKLTGSARTLKQGIYVFRESISVPQITRTITQNSSEREITLIEGWTNFEMAAYLEREWLFSQTAFLEAAKGQEGYLFPDTYRVFKNTAPDELVKRLRKTFDKKLKPLESEILRQEKTLKEVVITASLIEKESGANENDRKIISGILWKRLEAGAALRVDATLSYLTGKSSAELTEDDLAIDSPYNTYKYQGLPVGPIGNPGLAALEAAVHPKNSPYWFYLHDKEGNPHYAETFEEHIANKNKYLR